MPDIYETIKQICASERQASYPMEICYGTVISLNPFKIKLDQKKILSKAFFIAPKGVTVNSFEIGDILILFRQQGGQKYLIFDKMDNEKPYHLFFNGAIYDAYSLLCDILSQAQESIAIIDNYLDKNILDVFASIQKDVLIVTKNINKKDLEMYEHQYQNVKIIKNDSFHDRFIIIDKKTLYHCGASFKDLGKKCFAITKMTDEEILSQLLVKITEVDII